MRRNIVKTNHAVNTTDSEEATFYPDDLRAMIFTGAPDPSNPGERIYFSFAEELAVYVMRHFLDRPRRSGQVGSNYTEFVYAVQTLGQPFTQSDDRFSAFYPAMETLMPELGNLFQQLTPGDQQQARELQSAAFSNLFYHPMHTYRDLSANEHLGVLRTPDLI